MSSVYTAVIARAATVLAVGLGLPGCRSGGPPEVEPAAGEKPEAASQDKAEPPKPEAPRAVGEQRAPKPEAPADYVGKHVLVPRRAKLRTAPSDEAEFATLDLDERTDGAPATRTFDVVGSEGEFIAVRPALFGNRCTAWVPGLIAFDLKLWVRPQDLALVLARRTEIQGPSGDKATLWPGVPVKHGASGATVDLDGAAITVPLDVDRVSTAFDPEPPPELPETVGALEPGFIVTWEGNKIDHRFLRVARGPRPAAQQHDAADPGGRVRTVWTRCAELTGKLVNAEPQTPGAVATATPTNDSRGPVVRHVVFEGTEVFWASGTKAGVVTSSHDFTAPPKRRKGKMCFDVPLAEGADDDGSDPERSVLELCFDKSDVTERRRVYKEHSIAKLLRPSRGMVGLFSDSEEADEGSTGAESTLSPATLRRTISAHASDITACYQVVLKRRADAAGKIVLQLDIEPSGTVSSSEVVEDTVGGVADCAQRVAKTWRFPESSTSTSVTYPIVLSSAH